MAKSLLIIEDDQDLREYLQETLLDKGYAVQSVNDGVKALNLLKRLQPDLIILDLGLPNISGETVCQEVRKKYPQLPVIILTARDSTDDVVRGLNLGADDYITKPFETEVFLARIKARLRNINNHPTVMKISDLEYDTKSLEVHRNGRLIKLTPQELKLLEYLMSNKGQVLTREMILNRIWSSSPDIETRVVDVYIGYLRRKIDLESKIKLLHSIRGFGYMIKDANA